MPNHLSRLIPPSRSHQISYFNCVDFFKIFSWPAKFSLASRIVLIWFTLPVILIAPLFLDIPSHSWGLGLAVVSFKSRRPLPSLPLSFQCLGWSPYHTLNGSQQTICFLHIDGLDVCFIGWIKNSTRICTPLNTQSLVQSLARNWVNKYLRNKSKEEKSKWFYRLEFE